MAHKVDITLVDRVKDELANLISTSRRELKGCRYIDLRLGVGEGQGAMSQDGMSKFSLRDYTFSYGLRVIAGNGTTAAGYFGQPLGSADVDNLAGVIKDGLGKAYERSMANAKAKAERLDSWKILGQALQSTELAPVKVCRDAIPGVYRVNPLDVPLEAVGKLTQEASKAVAAHDPRVKVNQIMAQTSLNRELLVNSEGSVIDRTYALTQGFCVVVAIGDGGVQQTHYDCIGHQRGWELLTDGIDEDMIRSKSLMDFALDLAADNVSLTESRPCPSSDKEVVVVTDPHYNTLLVHEIIGHPTELDRALKLETAYAGRSWLLRSLKENMLGKEIASPIVSAYSDPMLPGFGHYEYDDEGTPVERVMHIDKGVFRGFMNSRQTAATLGVKPNGHYKAIDASLVPLIRMSTTVFGAGKSHPQQMIKDVEHGYYVAGHRIPSISESRENFRITSRKVFEIKNGELGEMFRDGGIMANTKDYLMSIDAVGNDLRIYPVFNCGKGQPMQAKKLGNGGPTLRGHARLVGGAK